MLNITSYTIEIKNGFQTLQIITTGSHNIKTEYIDVQITGATDPTYNGTFKFFVINDTTLENKTSKPINLFLKKQIIAGTITANVVNYQDLIGISVGDFTSLYTITNEGNYQIPLINTALYKILLYPVQQLNAFKIGERLDDADRVLYSNGIPVGIFKAKWLIVEVSTIKAPIEIRLIKQN